MSSQRLVWFLSNPFTSETVPQDSVDRKILSFKKLKAGWLYHDGEVFTDEVIEQARWVNKEAIQAGITTRDATPGPSGQISLCAYLGAMALEVRITKDLKMSLGFDGSDSIFEEEEDDVTCAVVIEKLQRFVWEAKLQPVSMYASSISPSFAASMPDSRATVSRVPAIKAGSRSFEWIVPLKLTARSAPMLEFTTLSSRLKTLFFSSLTQPRSFLKPSSSNYPQPVVIRAITTSLD